MAMVSRRFMTCPGVDHQVITHLVGCDHNNRFFATLLSSNDKTFYRCLRRMAWVVNGGALCVHVVRLHHPVVTRVTDCPTRHNQTEHDRSDSIGCKPAGVQVFGYDRDRVVCWENHAERAATL